VQPVARALSPAAWDPRPAPIPQLRKKVWPGTGQLWVLLALITGIGAFLRFWRIDAQAFWTDEAYTLGRISGSFDFLLSKLSDQGFPPGWYALLRWWRMWVEGRVGSEAIALQPVYMRMLPAFFGTLTVPALYFLGRQFTDRRGALLVALLGAVNPFLIYYSRDIKMYAALYFFVTLNMALFFQWQTTRRHWLWMPLFVMTGAAMLCVQVVAAALLALQLIFLLTRRRLRSLDVPLWLTGAALAAWYPLYWYLDYQDPALWGRRLSNQVQASMQWIVDYTDMSWHTLVSLPTSHVLGYLWPVYPPDARINNWFLLGDDFNEHLATRSLSWLAQWEWYAAIALFAILLGGLIPWRRLTAAGRAAYTPDPERERSVTYHRWWWVGLWILLPAAALALTWIPQDSPWFERIWHGSGPKPLWEPRYLGIILPAWLLWLGASLRRLPTLPLRVAAIGVVLGACTLSALTNHLVQRNPPFQQVAEVVKEFGDADREAATYVVVPDVKYPDPAEYVAACNAREIVPHDGVLPRDQIQNPGRRPWHDAVSPEHALALLSAALDDPRVRTIVFTDREGDLAAPALAAGDPLSDEAVERRLGPRWKLVHRESTRWYYEWRYYLFHTWRTRVWQMEPDAGGRGRSGPQTPPR
jgi:4-amino-4-deoxy-L-arabinose transferase-like glycosyltransferase